MKTMKELIERHRDVYHAQIRLTSGSKDVYPKKIWITSLQGYDNHNGLRLIFLGKDDNPMTIWLTN